VLAPSLLAFLWFSIFGGSALTMQIWQHVPIADAVRNDVATGLFAMFGAMPFGLAMSVVATVLVLVFFVTSGDSAVLVLGMMSTGGNPNPPARVKVIWGALVAGIAISLLLAGGLRAVQTATIVFALPLALVIVLMVVALWRAMREDWAEQQQRERAMRKRLREMAAR
jgi:glycine betaine transporter